MALSGTWGALQRLWPTDSGMPWGQGQPLPQGSGCTGKKGVWTEDPRLEAGGVEVASVWGPQS